ncbi:MAG TPA: VOC family protein [Stellaceae bacterium]|jgi:uncharacterized glyoxalase superfamily protein PhnB|nr:VOC family protein [Stellaceae bacterium]
MRANRSMPPASVIPVLAYHDVATAADWLCLVYGFTLRVSIGTHRAQLAYGDGSVVLNGTPTGAPSASSIRHSVMVRVDDVDSHYAQALAHNATILSPPADFPYGERQYTTRDIGGHIWTFSQTLDDVDPKDWGGTLHQP